MQGAGNGGATARVLIAAVWLYHGAWRKLAQPAGRHGRIVASVPVVGAVAWLATAAIGLLECVLAAWIASGRRPIAAAAVQSTALVAMNGAALRWASREVSPRRLAAGSGAFLAGAWWAALAARRR